MSDQTPWWEQPIDPDTLPVLTADLFWETVENIRNASGADKPNVYFDPTTGRYYVMGARAYAKPLA